MPAIPLIAIELLVAFGVPIAWGIWQLVSLRREKARDEAKEAERIAGEATPASAEAKKAAEA